jgi:hypothetical protein
VTVSVSFGRPQRWPGVAALALACLIGAFGATKPWLAMEIVVGVLGLGAAAVVAQRLPTIFLSCLGGLLLGYAFLGRGFAYLGAPPIYVGELVLILGVIAASTSVRSLRVLGSPLAMLWVAFALWGAVRTVPYLGRYGAAALRDSVIWSYGLFALLAAWFLRPWDRFAQVPQRYASWIPWFVLWVPVLSVVTVYMRDRLPTSSPGATIPSFKPGDVAVHLAGAGAFLLLGLDRMDSGTQKPASRRLSETALWTFWTIGFMIVTALNRSGFLAMLFAGATVIFLRGSVAKGRFLRIAAITLVLGIGALSADVSLAPFSGRSASTRQIMHNLASITGSGDDEGLQGSREWRLAWWRNIVDNTLYGDEFWTGRGFGMSLADDAYFQVDEALRSPHNGHMTILAREGVPGIVLWGILQLAFAASLVRAFVRARAAGQEWWARLNVWVLAYWVAFVVNMTFDVYLEGPQGGIWFWSLFGFGIAALERQRSAIHQQSAELRTRSAPVAQPFTRTRSQLDTRLWQP